MSKLLEIQEQILATCGMIAKNEKSLALSPQSRSLALAGKSLAKRLKELESEFLAMPMRSVVGRRLTWNDVTRN